MSRQAIVLAGGLGTRLRCAIPNLPKVLAPVAGRPFALHLLDFLESRGFTRAILATGFRHGDVEAALGYRHKNLVVDYSVENAPLGTGGAVWLAAQKLDSEQNFFVFNGDTYAEAEVDKMEELLTAQNADIAMAVRHSAITGRYGLIDEDESGMVTGFREKIPGHRGMINAGVYLIRHDLPRRFPFPPSFSLETDFLQKDLTQLRIVAVPFGGYFVDIGVPEDFERANKDFTADKAKR